MSLPAQPFTLWLSPDVWPKPALRLPGEAFTLWQDPDRWPKPKLRLPSAGTTLWLDEGSWPVRTDPPALVPAAIPAAVSTFTLPVPPVSELSAVDDQVLVSDTRFEPDSAPVPSPDDSPPVQPESVPAPETVQDEIVDSASPTDVVVPLSIPDFPIAAPVTAPPMIPPITLTANHSFTLWTLPSPATIPAAAAVPLRNIPLRLPGQPFTIWTQPERVDRITMRNVPAAAAAASVAPLRPARSGGQRWVYIAAAAALALAAFMAMKFFSEKSQRETLEGDYAALEMQKAAELSTANAKSQEALSRAAIAASELNARTADFTSEIATVKTALTEAKATSEKLAKNLSETTGALEKAEKARADAAKEYSAKETTLQNNMTALTEETSKIKRVAGEEASKAKETVAKLEEQKAAAVKDAAAAMSDRDVLKAEVEKLRKQLESKPKAAGAPEA